MNKCEWCEEGRYTSIIPTRNMNSRFNALYCLDLQENEKGYFMEIYRQKPPQVYWNTLFKKQINYCPFCGRKLESESNE
ncbi:MAG: hypothetical protein IKN65_00955 [Clostridia bacterium]|nr:hypothetical protein [Clostridia bacterium]